MTVEKSDQVEEQKIREVIENWAAATRFDKKADVLKHHASDVLVFDVLPPLKYEGADAYRETWDQWQPEFEIPSLFNIHDLNIVVDNNLAFCHCLIECGGRLPNGSEVKEWVRATFCLAKHEDKWLIKHQHISMPLDVSRDNP
jgi:ketosteroid isomerase-like protein